MSLVQSPMKRYVPDLMSLQRTCEVNYMTLMKRMAEVCAAQQISRLQPRYDYPNKNMHQRDEKEQVNLFLADWLKFCLRHGTSLINIL